MNTVPAKYQGLRSFAFGDGPALADELLDLVIREVKTATCSTEDEPNTSKPGECWIVLDGRGKPACVIETLEVTYRRYNEVDAAFAYEEGEGDRSLALLARGAPQLFRTAGPLQRRHDADVRTVSSGRGFSKRSKRRERSDLSTVIAERAPP